MSFLQQLVLQDMITRWIQTSGKNKFLGAFAKMQGATISLFVCVCPSVCQCVRSLGTTRLT